MSFVLIIFLSVFEILPGLMVVLFESLTGDVEECLGSLGVGQL